jgi:hypothetical protein
MRNLEVEMGIHATLELSEYGDYSTIHDRFRGFGSYQTPHKKAWITK